VSGGARQRSAERLLEPQREIGESIADRLHDQPTIVIWAQLPCGAG
jgi:hypothetical protein